MALSSISLKGKALRWLAQREHSRTELHHKLQRFVEDSQRKAQAQGSEAPYSPADISQVLDDLAATGFQSDTRTAETTARAKSDRYGMHRLRQHLKVKGLSDDLVSHALAGTQGTELQRALKLWERRYGVMATNPAEQARQTRFLTARGFDSDVVRRVVRGLYDDS
jgi:regulatory protein